MPGVDFAPGSATIFLKVRRNFFERDFGEIFEIYIFIIIIISLIVFYIPLDNSKYIIGGN